MANIVFAGAAGHMTSCCCSIEEGFAEVLIEYSVSLQSMFWESLQAQHQWTTYAKEKNHTSPHVCLH